MNLKNKLMNLLVKIVYYKNKYNKMNMNYQGKMIKLKNYKNILMDFKKLNQY